MIFEDNSTEFFSYLDDNTPHLYGSDYDMLLKELEDKFPVFFPGIGKTNFKQMLGNVTFLSPFEHKSIDLNNLLIKNSELAFTKHIMKLDRNTNPYSSTNNFFSPIPVSDWLIFCCRNFILHQKK